MSDDAGFRELIPPALDGERIDRIIALLADVSRNRAAAALTAGRVSVDDEVVYQRSRRVHEGEELVVAGFERETEHVPGAEPSVRFDILYADDDVLVIDKPSGLVVHPGAGNQTGTLVNGLLASHPEIAGVGSAARPGIVHRLDMGTSGVLAVARTQVAYDSLVAQLADRSVGRRYQALSWGHFEAVKGVVDAPVGRSPKDRTRMAVVASGRPARTGYEVSAAWASPAVSLVTCTLETGRTHQIRVHLSAIGHPLLGDGTYGGERSGLVLDRPFLHAAHLSFDHPATGERLEFDSPLPADLRAVLDGLGEPEPADQ
ncbi:MAG: RluA family pseudouridine synthase [Acidimicrobiaceae bacterium]|nr:RluA family pseudouridine synthase [Acidimicrobiaceae bacterium]